MQTVTHRAVALAAALALTAPAAASAHPAHAAHAAPKTWCTAGMCAAGHRHKRHIVWAVTARKARVA
jgi:uncharacterized low-complexity protein